MEFDSDLTPRNDESGAPSAAHLVAVGRAPRARLSDAAELAAPALTKARETDCVLLCSI